MRKQARALIAAGVILSANTNKCIECKREKELMKSHYCHECRDAILREKVRDS